MIAAMPADPWGIACLKEQMCRPLATVVFYPQCPGGSSWARNRKEMVPCALPFPSLHQGKMALWLGAMGGGEFLGVRGGEGGGGVVDWEHFQKVNIYRKCWPVRTPVSYFGKKMRAHRKKKENIWTSWQRFIMSLWVEFSPWWEKNDKKQALFLLMKAGCTCGGTIWINLINFL